MDPRIETVTQEWRFRSCDPGYAGLHALAEGGFSGSVAAEGATGFMVNGRLVGISGGSVESFWSSDIAALEATDPSEALLCAMLIANGTVEAEYYTGETPIDTVHEKLSSGGFSGYLELSENVFSGDYFITYYGGTAKSVALLGTEERVITGDEAYERACDEVGIYEVKKVSVEVIDIPEPEVDDSAIEEPDPIAEEPTEPSATDVGDDETSEESMTAEADSPNSSKAASETTASPQETTQSRTSPGQADSQDLAALAEAARGGEAAAVTHRGPDQVSSTDEMITIPALDPATTVSVEPEQKTAESEDTSSAPVTQEVESTEDQETQSSVDEEEIDELTAELDAATRENERLRNRVEELEDRIAELEGGPDETDFSPPEAINGTNLFVRYQTKGRNTLEEAVNGTADQAAIAQNLQLERHTQFDATDVIVEGEPYDDFLRMSLEYRFVSWLLNGLLFELREAGQDKRFEALVEVFPQIDRIEFHGTVPIHTDDGGERRSDQFTFDVVFRNSMGAALLVANVHDDRQPVDEGPVADLLAAANDVATAKPSLSGAFFVARSYFEPKAMETVADATGGGLLRGGSRESYVSVSRKHGFHLCLVEARDSTFHLNVPE